MFLDKRIPLSYILNKIKIDLIFVVIVGVAFNYLTMLFSKIIPDMPISVPSFLGTAISILLSFKMSQSYDRWWEARKAWGAIVNDSRSLILQLQNYIRNKELIERMAYRQIAFCYSLGQSLRRENPLKDIDKFLNGDELNSVEKHHNKPLAILQLNSSELKILSDKKEIELFSQIQIDATLIRLCESMGIAERINTTVFPVTYRLFLHYAIFLFVIILSISLKGIPMIFEVPLLVLISSVLFLLETSAYHIQDPFRGSASDVPVTTIARTIEINIKQLIKDTDVPEPIVSEKFYAM